MQDLEDMLGFRPYSFYYYMWRYVSPAVLIVLIAATVIEMAISPAGYNAWVEAEVSVQFVLFMCLQKERQTCLLFFPLLVTVFFLIPVHSFFRAQSVSTATLPGL